MLMNNQYFGFLTSLKEEDVLTNFFEGLKYKENSEKVIKYLIDLNAEVNNIDVCECFDYESDDEYQNTFRFISFTYNTQLHNIINRRMENYLNIIESVYIDDEGRICVKFK